MAQNYIGDISYQNNVYMNLLAPVRTIMTQNLITVEGGETLLKVEELFKEHNIHHLPITDNGKLIGLISKTDFLLFKRGFIDFSTEAKYDLFRLKTHFAKEIMTKGLAKLESTDKINVALEIFKKNILHALPVVDDGQLVGMVTTHDIIRHLADDRSAVNQYTKHD
jgi:CBS domain-containing protein